mgnify:CR=1 FL=1
MDEEDVIDALTRLGLKTYEARVFVALQKLGTGTASDVAEITDVPRSQVYGAADGLEESGLLDVQQTRPTVYRPVSPAEAETRLLEQLESVGREAFAYLEDVRGTIGEDNEQSEALWTVRGQEYVCDRAIELVGEADERIVYGAPDPQLLEDDLLATLVAAAESGLSVSVVSENPAVLDRIDDAPIETVYLPEEHFPDASTARLLVVDDDTILMSVRSSDVAAEEEIAFWSAETSFAMVLVSLACELFATE